MCLIVNQGERGGSVVECRTPEREVGVRYLPPPCCVLEQDTYSPKVLVNYPGSGGSVPT